MEGNEGGSLGKLGGVPEIVPPASISVGRCLIFNILGNNYRLITVVSWRNQRIYIKAFLTHREYERNIWHKWAD